MNPNLSKKVSSKIEELCAQGCSQVNQLLEDANNGKNIVLPSEFSYSEIEQIIDELTQIMAVYKTGNNDSDDNDPDIGCK
jgi:hypothetical protein